MRRLLITAIMALTASMTLSAVEPPAELVVWTGDKPTGRTWAKLGTGGGLTIEDGAGLGTTKKKASC